MTLFNKFKKDGNDLSMTKTKFLVELGKAYRLGVTDGAIAQRRGDMEFLAKHSGPKKFLEA